MNVRNRLIVLLFLFPLALGISRSASAESPAPYRLMSPERHEQYRRLLPRVADPAVQAMLDDPRLLLYTEREMPSCYQLWDGSLPGVHASDYNISANGREPHGNGNKEFPWGTPLGVHRSPNVESFRFLWLPLDETGATRPIVWYSRRLPGDSRSGYAWLYPVGAVVGEVLMLPAPSGGMATFEVRMRIREHDAWGVEVLRPFPTANHLAERIAELRPEWRDAPALSALMEHLTESRALPTARLVNHHPGPVVDQVMGVDTLPPVGDDALVTELLTTTPFESALDETWRVGPDGSFCAAPTTDAPYHIVPAKYDAGFVEVNRVSCARCHETVSRHVRRFQRGRDWYGRIRGSDGIFSFHPFARRGISHNGMGQSVSIRADLVSAGVVASYDSAEHTSAHYAPIKQFHP